MEIEVLPRILVRFQLTRPQPTKIYDKWMLAEEVADRFHSPAWEQLEPKVITLGDEQIVTHRFVTAESHHVEAWWTTTHYAF